MTDFWDASSRTLRASAPYRALTQDLSRRAESGRRAEGVPGVRRAEGVPGVQVARLPVTAAAWVMALLAEDLGRQLLVVVPHESDAYAWLEAARLFGGETAGGQSGDAVYFPAPALSPYQEAEISLMVRAEESRAVDRIVRGLATTVVTTPRALFRRLPRGESFAPAALTVRPDEEHPVDELMAHLVRWGYRRSDLVFEVGQFAVRGGVFDVFPPGCELPVRLDLFGDTVESIRTFDAESQRSLDTASELHLLPLSLFPQGEEQAWRVADLLAEQAGPSIGQETAERVTALREGDGFDGWEHYLPLLAEETLALPDLLDNPLVVGLDPESLGHEVEHHAETLDIEFRARIAQSRPAIPPDVLEHPAERATAVIDSTDVWLGSLFVKTSEAIDFAATATDLMHDKLALLSREVDTARTRGDRVVLVAPEDHRPRVAELLEVHEVPLAGLPSGATFGTAGVELVSGDLQRGFHLPAAGLTLFSERQLVRKSPLMRRPAAKGAKRFGPFLSSLRDLKVGDYVVHTDHGIGQFVALRHLGGEAADHKNLPQELATASPEGQPEVEVMEIAYSKGQRLLLPLSRLAQVQKYSGIDAISPRLDRLGGISWNRTKRKIKKGMRDMAKELLKLYAERQLAEAPKITEQLGPDAAVRRRLRARGDFRPARGHPRHPGRLWPSPGRWIACCAATSASARPRSPCGRPLPWSMAAIRWRCWRRRPSLPTSISRPFSERFAGTPVEIDMISRFRSAAQARDIEKRSAAQGKIDILIGTHRLLSRKVKLPKLGLVIVDEEQRFGVAHKERLKQLRKDVHMLAMSATPVPRTLQLSLGRRPRSISDRDAAT